MACYSVTFGGELYGDIWQCGLHMLGDAGGITSVPYDTILADIKTDVTTWFTAIGVTSAAKLNRVSFNEIDPLTKKYVSATNSYELSFTGIPGTVSSNLHPQISLCNSLLTGAKRGIAARGRIYPPPTVQVNQVGNDGQLASGARLAMATATKNLVANLNNWPGLNLPTVPEVVILGYDGSMRKVTSVSVGSIPDTQRRRRNALKETYTEVAL